MVWREQVEETWLKDYQAFTGGQQKLSLRLVTINDLKG